MRAMANLVDPEVELYAAAHTTAPPPFLESVETSTREGFAAWGMMVGRLEGRFLEMLVFAAQATRVLEIGTFTGYSAIAMAAGLAPGGSIISLEVDPHHAVTARGNIAAGRTREPHQRDRGPGAAVPRASSRAPSTSSSSTPTRSPTTPTTRRPCPSWRPTG